LAATEWLFRELERVAAAGSAILYITHRLGEVRRLCARATILRNGENVGTIILDRVSDGDIFAAMLGVAPAARLSDAALGSSVRREIALSVHDLTGAGGPAVSLDVRKGEIVGVAALAGQGQRELFRILGGAARLAAGTIAVDGRIINPRSPGEALRERIAFLPEERKSEGIFLGLDVTPNISLSSLNLLRRFGIINRGAEHRYVGAQARRVDLAEQLLDMPMAALSGGNQQKAFVARVLAAGARMLVLFDPTRGVDIGTKQTIYGVIRDFAAEGGSVLIYSTELEELVQLVHRCLVMYRGRIVGEVSGEHLSEGRLLSLASGQGQTSSAGDEVAPAFALSPVASLLGNGAIVISTIFLLLFAVYAGVQRGGSSLLSLTQFLNNALPGALAAAGATLVVLTREFDLSVAGVVALCNVLIVTVIGTDPSAPFSALLLALAVGLAVGLVNGILVAYLDLQSVAATLGTMIICSGLALLVLEVPGGEVADAMAYGLTGTIGVVPVAALVALGVALFWLAIRCTDFGVAVYAVGADRAASELAGIATRRTRLSAFCLAGMFYGAAGYMLTAFTATGDPNAGRSYLISVYAAIAIGGTSFAGGRGGLIASMIGAATLILLQKVLFSLGVLSFYMGIVEGVIMIAAVMIGAFSAPSQNGSK
jgi:ribose/xylose/arabinose/galactoside ABC-type transport system permease subunit/ABC-type multidrug transport system ATPase subunit